MSHSSEQSGLLGGFLQCHHCWSTLWFLLSQDFLASGPSWSVPGPMPSCPGTSREGIALLESLVHTLSFSMSIRNFTTNITLCIGPPDSGTKVFAEKLRPSRKKREGVVYCTPVWQQYIVFLTLIGKIPSTFATKKSIPKWCYLNIKQS